MQKAGFLIARLKFGTCGGYDMDLNEENCSLKVLLLKLHEIIRMQVDSKMSFLMGIHSLKAPNKRTQGTRCKDLVVVIAQLGFISICIHERPLYKQ